MNRADRRRWLAQVRADNPDLDADALAVAEWLAENVDDRGEIELTADALDRLHREAVN